MIVRMPGLVKRGGVYIYRRMVPSRLHSIIGKHEWKISLGTSDLAVAQRRLPAVVADVERELKEAEAGRKNPAILAYRAVQEWKQQSAPRPADEDADEGMDSYLTTVLERDEMHGKKLDAGQRAVLEALLRRHEEDGEDNPPLSILFERYYAERQLPAKTKLEWEGVCRRFCETIGNDLPARSVTQAHVRQFKTSLLTSTSKRTGKPMAPATVQK